MISPLVKGAEGREMREDDLGQVNKWIRESQGSDKIAEGGGCNRRYRTESTSARMLKCHCWSTAGAWLGAPSP